MRNDLKKKFVVEVKKAGMETEKTVKKNIERFGCE